MQGDGSAALPHVSVPNISYVDWAALKRAGFEGAVFDKDNTLTEPYAIAIAPILVDSLRKCIQTFDGKVVLLSNSAGLEEFDPEGELLQLACSFKLKLCINQLFCEIGICRKRDVHCICIETIGFYTIGFHTCHSLRRQAEG